MSEASLVDEAQQAIGDGEKVEAAAGSLTLLLTFSHVPGGSQQ